MYTTSDHDIINNRLDYINNTNHTNDNEVKNSKKIEFLTSFFPKVNHSTETRNSSMFMKPAETKDEKFDYIYNKLNRQRLELMDILLKFDADKNLVTNLSTSCFKKLNKKSQSRLRKWFGINKLSKSQENNGISELRPFSPMMASLCLDDIEIFSRLYMHHQALSSYFKPDEYLNLLNSAIEFQSENCLMFLLSKSKHKKHLANESNENNNNFFASITTSNPHHFQKNDQNVKIMFYIIDNTRSSKIIAVLLKCDFDLTKREQSTGNTVLHCLLSGKRNGHFNNNCEANGLFYLLIRKQKYFPINIVKEISKF